MNLNQQVVHQIHHGFISSRATIEKWLAYPRQLQQEYGLNVILAGGAIRDLLMGHEPKDLDIWVTPSAWVAKRIGWSETVVAKLGEREGWTHDGEVHDNPSHPSLMSVWSFKSQFVEPSYNIVVLGEDTNSNRLIGGFDFGINMVAVNTYTILAMSEFFIEDIAGNKITLRNERDRDTVLRRYEQLSKKYPVPLVTPEGLELAKPTSGLILPPGVTSVIERGNSG